MRSQRKFQVECLNKGRLRRKEEALPSERVQTGVS